MESGTAGRWRQPKTAADSFNGRLEKLHDTRYMTLSGTHCDGGPFGISLALAAQAVSLEMGVLRAGM